MKKCNCKYCTIEKPRLDNVERALESSEALDDFKHIVSDLIHAEDDVNYYQCLLNGDWPGWKWMKYRKQILDFVKNFLTERPKIYMNKDDFYDKMLELDVKIRPIFEEYTKEDDN
jgi:hypothetical protein